MARRRSRRLSVEIDYPLELSVLLVYRGGHPPKHTYFTPQADDILRARYFLR